MYLKIFIITTNTLKSYDNNLYTTDSRLTVTDASQCEYTHLKPTVAILAWLSLTVPAGLNPA